jgi:hypothetical protein
MPDKTESDKQKRARKPSGLGFPAVLFALGVVFTFAWAAILLWLALHALRVA